MMKDDIDIEIIKIHIENEINILKRDLSLSISQSTGELSDKIEHKFEMLKYYVDLIDLKLNQLDKHFSHYAKIEETLIQIQTTQQSQSILNRTTSSSVFNWLILLGVTILCFK